MIIVCAFIGFIVGFIPMASFLLIPLEGYLLYSIMDKYHAFDLWVFLGSFTVLAGLSFLLKGLASFLHALPGIGQFANSIVACGWILVFGFLADKHYAELAKPEPRSYLSAPAPGPNPRDMRRLLA